jgi:LysM repeat protein
MYCKRCGTPLHTGVVICPECGARQRRQASSVRCASCHGRVPLTLSVCPRCGREVRPAGPRWGVWLAVAIGLVLVVLWSLGKMPIERVGQEIAGIKSKVSGLVQVLGPAPTNTKAAATPELLARTTPAAPPTPTAEAELPLSAPEADLVVDVGEGESPTAEPSPAETGLNTGVETPAAGQQTATAASTLTSTSTATLTLPPSPTATAVPPTATVLPPTATAAPLAGNKANTYRIQSGDTLSGIAQRFDVSLAALLAANGISANAMLRIGQALVIPGASGPPAPTATPKPRATPTPVKPVLPPTPAPYLAAPLLTGPGEQASYHGETEQIFLIWDAVPGMTADDRYQVDIRWVEQGALQEKSDLFTPATSIQMPPWLWGRADQPDRKYQWFIRAVRLTTDGQGGEVVIPLSPTSPTRTLYWN